MENEPTKLNKGKTKKRLMGAVKDNLKLGGSIGKDAIDRERWKKIICCGYCQKNK